MMGKKVHDDVNNIELRIHMREFVSPMVHGNSTQDTRAVTRYFVIIYFRNPRGIRMNLQSHD